MIGLTRQGSLEYASDGIRVNVIVPGWHAGTRLGGVPPGAEEQIQDFVERVVPLTPMQRRGEPAELKGLAIYLASDASSFVTGATFVHDGGWCAW